MNNRLAVSLIAASLFASGAALAQSTTATGAVNGARTGGEVAGPVGEIVGGTVGAAVGAAVEIPNAVITSIPEREPSVTVRERVVVGEPLPSSVCCISCLARLMRAGITRVEAYSSKDLRKVPRLLSIFFCS